MSWKLVKSTGEVYFLLPTSTCRVGRQGCQVLIPDTTVSRHHASIEVSFDRVDDFSPACSSVTLKDVSKFVQTSVNGALLSQSNRLVTLMPDDVLSFGACPDTFALRWDPYILMVTEASQIELLKHQALNCGLVLTDSSHPSAKGIIVPDGFKDFSSNQKLIRVYLDGIPLLKSTIVSVLTNHPSGSMDLPSIETHAFPVPNSHVDRKHLFQDCSFLVRSGSVIAGILLECGASVLTTLKRAISDVYVMQDDGDELGYKFKIQRARIVIEVDVLDAVWAGDVGKLARIQPIDIYPKKSDSENTQPSSWISKAEEVHGLQKSDTKPLNDNKYQQPGQSSKKFKKARVMEVADTKVTLCDWNGTTKLNRSTDQNVSFNRDRDDIDAWMRSTNSQ